MAIQITQVEVRTSNFVKTTELRNYPFICINIKRMAYNVPGYQGKGETTKVIGDFICFDAEHNVVFEKKDAQWDCGIGIGSKLPDRHPATIVVQIRKESGRDGKDYNNLYNVGSPDIEPIIAVLEKREAELQAAMEDAPAF